MAEGMLILSQCGESHLCGLKRTINGQEDPKTGGHVNWEDGEKKVLLKKSREIKVNILIVIIKLRIKRQGQEMETVEKKINVEGRRGREGDE